MNTITPCLYCGTFHTSNGHCTSCGAPAKPKETPAKPKEEAVYIGRRWVSMLELKSDADVNEL